jgi:uncharacterized repeat protein (TIGR03803 family)
MFSRSRSRRHSVKYICRRQNRASEYICRAVVEAAEPRVLLSVANYTLNTLATFTGSNGSEPDGALIADGTGNLYGTASGGGPDVDSNGTVFEVAADATHTLTTLGTFTGDNGSTPQGNLVDSGGNFFGTTQQGGANQFPGTVFEVTPGSNTASAIVSFDQSDGFFPEAGMVADANGNLFGTTSGGGTNNDGLVFEVSNGIESTVATFDGDNGSSPEGTLLIDGSGNLFGTTATGGGANDDGTVFEITNGTINTLATFNGSNGARPVANLIEFDGNLYGTTAGGGPDEAGTVFEVNPTTQTLTTIVSFNGTDGSGPYGGVIADSSGDLFGTTNAGGSNGDGVVFEIPAGLKTPTTLVTFNGTNGRNPFAGLLADANGNLYGTTNQGGSSDDGTVFELTPSSSGGGGGGGTSGTASQLVFTQQPGSATAGGKLSSVIVKVEDSSGNVVTTNRSKVTLTLAGGSGIKITGSTSAAVKNGEAVFSHLSIRTAGSYSLQASDGQLTAATSTSFTINPAAAKKLIFSDQPPTTVPANNTFAVQIELLDQYGNVATDDSTTATLVLGSHPKDSTLTGILSETPVDGLADFTGLSLSTVGNYTLKAADGKLKANSSKFVVT